MPPHLQTVSQEVFSDIMVLDDICQFSSSLGNIHVGIFGAFY